MHFSFSNPLYPSLDGGNSPREGDSTPLFITFLISMNYTNYGWLLFELPGVFYPTSHTRDSVNHSSIKIWFIEDFDSFDVIQISSICYQGTDFLFCVCWWLWHKFWDKYGRCSTYTKKIKRKEALYNCQILTDFLLKFPIGTFYIKNRNRSSWLNNY
jgi:hypothetical protein